MDFAFSDSGSDRLRFVCRLVCRGPQLNDANVEAYIIISPYGLFGKIHTPVPILVVYQGDFSLTSVRQPDKTDRTMHMDLKNSVGGHGVSDTICFLQAAGVED